MADEFLSHSASFRPVIIYPCLNSLRINWSSELALWRFKCSSPLINLNFTQSLNSSVVQTEGTLHFMFRLKPENSSSAYISVYPLHEYLCSRWFHKSYKTLQEQLLLIMTQNSLSQQKVQNYSADCSEA